MSEDNGIYIGKTIKLPADLASCMIQIQNWLQSKLLRGIREDEFKNRYVTVSGQEVSHFFTSTGGPGFELIFICQNAGWLMESRHKADDEDGELYYDVYDRVNVDSILVVDDPAEFDASVSPRIERRAKSPDSDAAPDQVDRVREVLRRDSSRMTRDAIQKKLKDVHGRGVRHGTLTKILDQLRDSGDYTG